MIRKQKLIIASIVFILTFVITTNFLLKKLMALEDLETNNNFKRVKNIHDQIYLELKRLPKHYFTVKPFENPIVNNFIKQVDQAKQVSILNNVDNLWKTANSWISPIGIVDFSSHEIGNLLWALENTKIIKSDLDTRGTQLKFLFTLEGNQTVIFKPKWYSKEVIIEGPVYAGKDRYGAEIIGFYLSIILNMPFAPCSIERKISLTLDVLPVATKQLLNTSYSFGNRTCIYGNCFYCKKQDPICEDNSFSLYGAVIFNVNAPFKKHRSPWQRTYKKNKKALWEEDDNYCKHLKQKLTTRRLLDLIDTSIFDFLIQNGDRHHYETLHDNVLLIDNGKGFGNPHVTHLDILAPLYQCCKLRRKTFKQLENLAGGSLKSKLKAMPYVDNLVTEAHLSAIEKRLLLVFAAIEYCKRHEVENSN